MARGGTAYDLLIGEQAYKYDWTDGAEHRLRRVRIERKPSDRRSRDATPHGASDRSGGSGSER